MTNNCFFCDVQNIDDSQKIIENELFYARYDDFPVNPGHCLVFPKNHLVSLFDLSDDMVLSLYHLLIQTKSIIDENYSPDGFNIGVNEGRAAGRTQDHLHLQIIPRYNGDVENPCGGIRNLITGRGDYSDEMRKRFPEREGYFPE
jgi:diadenosine tetraphosphate (Ap4A) HIT family hydrolase